MNLPSKTLIFLSTALALSACMRHEDATTADAHEPPDPLIAVARPTDAPEAEGHGDAVALGLLSALNEHEIAAAQQAKAKNVSGPVLEYADLMEKEHGENQARTAALGTPATTAEVAAMKKKGTEDLKALAEKSGSDYETAYIAAMVSGHEAALREINDEMMPAATTEAVRQHLSETRGHVEMHLERARALQAGR